MSKITINGVEYYSCLDCGCWNITTRLCKCREEGKSKAVLRFIDVCRKKYNIPIFTTPYHGLASKEEKHEM